MKKNNQLRNKTLKGLLWSFIDLMANQGIQFIIMIILARLLLPEHFGILGMIMIFVALSQIFIDSGFSQALIREKEVTKIEYSTVFIVNITFSIVVFFIIYFIAPYVSEFYGEPQITSILRVVGLVVLFQAISIVPKTILIRNVNFKLQAKASIISSISSGIIAILLAFYGFGVWSLVFRIIFQKLVESMVLIYVNKWIPSFKFDLEAFKRFYGFGWKLLVSSLIDTFYHNIYYVIIGKMYTPKELGFYTNARQLRDAINKGITSSIQRVTYPVLSSVQTEEEKLKYGFKKLIRVTAYVFFPVMIGIASIAEGLIILLLGEQWEPAILYFQLLCIVAILYPMHAINLNILKVKGRSDLFLKLEIIKKLITTIALAITILLDLGVTSFIISAIITTHLGLFANTYYSGKEINYGTVEQIKDLLTPYLLSFSMGIIVLLFGRLVDMNNLITVILQTILGILVYVSLSVLFKVNEFKAVLSLIRKG